MVGVIFMASIPKQAGMDMMDTSRRPMMGGERNARRPFGRHQVVKQTNRLSLDLPKPQFEFISIYIKET